ncbi:hypothetical protein [Psychrobacter sp. JCM 18901]|uniref:hypothetical protein n=1 Tax=Psychrobacter sp. JCM 18901 TaxID=1298609 RepID=UPI0021C4A113|nr:hypothetical protein [Psychrobacter sp. JCM 18901]
MTELYLMRNPPELRSVLGESTNNSLSLTVVLPNTSTDNARPLEFKEMPTTTVDSQKFEEQASVGFDLPASKIINGESCYNAYDGTAIYYRYC